MDTDRCRFGGTAADRTAMPSWSLMSRWRAMSRAVDSVAVAVSPSKHFTPNRSLNTYDSNQIHFVHRVSEIVDVFSKKTQSVTLEQAIVEAGGEHLSRTKAPKPSLTLHNLR